MLDSRSSTSSPAASRTVGHLVISPATVHDVRRLADIEFHAFEGERINQQLSYRDYTKPEHFERTVSSYAKCLGDPDSFDSQPKHANRPRSDSKALEPAKSTSTISFLKVTDTETDEILSFAKTEIKQYSQEELIQPADVGHEDEPQMNRDWFALNERLRRGYVGLAKHCCESSMSAKHMASLKILTKRPDIGMLATQPCYQHNGAGTMLLNIVLTEADEAGVEVILESTDTAKPLYERHGFVAVTEIRFSPAAYGVYGLGTERQTVMVRGALNEDGQRREVKAWEKAMEQTSAVSSM